MLFVRLCVGPQASALSVGSRVETREPSAEVRISVFKCSETPRTTKELSQRGMNIVDI